MVEVPMLLLHAFPLDSRMWDPVRARLAERVRLITPDQRGMGRSPLPETDREPTLDDAAADVLALLDRLELDRVVLGGCSMGGYLAMAVLAAAPERVAGLALIDTKAAADSPEARENRLTVARRAEAEGVSGWLAEQMVPNLLGDTSRAERGEVVRRTGELIDSQPPAGVAWAQRAMAVRRDRADLLRSVDVPALVAVGEEDGLTPPSAAEEMAGLLQGSRLAVLPGAGHLPSLETPDALAAELLGWLSAATA